MSVVSPMAIFRGNKCAMAFSSAASHIALKLRAGLHTGEVEVRGEDIAGIVVNAAARIMGEAGPGEILVSSSCNGSRGWRRSELFPPRSA